MKKLLSILLVLMSFRSMAQHGNFTDIRLINGSAGLAGTNNGTIYFDTGSGTFKFRQGGSWLELGTITGSFTANRIAVATGSNALTTYASLLYSDITNRLFVNNGG